MKKILFLIFVILISQISVFAENSAIDEYTKIINSNPQNKNILVANYCMRGIMYKAQQNYNAALQDFLKAKELSVESNKINYIIYQELSETQFYLKDYDNAIMNMSKAITLNSGDSYYYYLRAKMYLAKGNYTKVLADATKSIQLKNKNPNAFYIRGLAEYKIGDKDKAKQDINFAKQQYYDLGMYEKYQEIVTLINQLDETKNPHDWSKDFSIYAQTDDGIRIILP